MSVKEPKAKATGKGAVQTPGRKPKTDKIDSKTKASNMQVTEMFADTETRTATSESVPTTPLSAKKKPKSGSAKKAATVIPQVNVPVNEPVNDKSVIAAKTSVEAHEPLAPTVLPGKKNTPIARRRRMRDDYVLPVRGVWDSEALQFPDEYDVPSQSKVKSSVAKKRTKAPTPTPAVTKEPIPTVKETPAASIPSPVPNVQKPSTSIPKKTTAPKKPAKKGALPVSDEKIPTEVITPQQVAAMNEPPAPPVDDVWEARLQAIDARYGNDRRPTLKANVLPQKQDSSRKRDIPQKQEVSQKQDIPSPKDIPLQEKSTAKQGTPGAKPPQNQKKNIQAKQAEQPVLQEVTELTTPAESLTRETEEDTPKLSYWQQRRLNKKLKQQASQSSSESAQTDSAAIVSPTPPEPSMPLPVKRDGSPKSETPNPILVEAILKALEENETVTTVQPIEALPSTSKEEILQALETQNDTATSGTDDDSEPIAPKLSYWQQRRLNKKLKQQASSTGQASTEQRTTPEQTAPPTPAIESVNEAVAQVQVPTIYEDIPATVIDSIDNASIPENTDDSSSEQDDSDEIAPKLSYWQQRRLNKKLKQQALKADGGGSQVQVEQPPAAIPPVNVPKAQPSTLQPFVTRKETPLAQAVPVAAVEPIAQVEAIAEVPAVPPKKLTKVQQRQLDKKLKLQAEEDARQAEAAAAALAAQSNETADEEMTADSPATDLLDEPIAPKLSYWQQRRLNKKLKQLAAKPEGSELLPTEEVVTPQVVASQTVKPEIAPEPIIDEESSAPLESQEQPKKLTYWQQKRLNKKLAKQRELEQAGLLPQENVTDTPTEAPVEKRILPVPEGKRILPVPEGKKILPVTEGKKVLPVPEGKKILPVPEGKKVLPVPDGKKILPVPEGKKVLPVPEGKKILPVPEGKKSPHPSDKKAHPHHDKRELEPVIEQHVPLPPLVAPKTQYPPKPKPVLPPLPEELLEMVARVERFMNHELNVFPEATILLGVSGGVDSMVMLDIFAYLSHKYDFSIHVGHCNHHLRGEDSHEDERLVKRVTHKYGLYYHHTSLKVQEFATKHKNSVEQAARTLRYHFFEKMAKTTVSHFVATAHTADDSAETFLLNLLRGSGLTGLAGIPARRELSKRVHVIRPMLPLLKSEVIQYATLRGLEWREDASNKSLLYTRNKIRLQLLPTLREQFSPAIVETINRTARLLLGADEIVNERAETLISMMVRSVGKSAVAISIPHFESANDFLKGEIIQKILKEKFQTLPVSMHTIDRIIGLATGAENAMCSVTPALDALRDRQEIILRKKNAVEVVNLQIPKTGKFTTDTFTLSMKELTKKDVKFSDNPNIEFFDADLMPLWLNIRSWQDGDRIQPLGMAGSMTVGDFLTNEKVELLDKERTLVLCAGTEVIWICGRRASDKFKVTPATKRIICAEYFSKVEQPPKPEIQKDR